MEIPEKAEKWDHNENLLRALALADSGSFAEAEAEFQKALKAMGAHSAADKDLIGITADLLFAYGRLLHEMKRSPEAFAKLQDALRLYTKAYGIDDSRTLFCQRKIKELARALEDADELAKAEFFLRAHRAFEALKQTGLLERQADQKAQDLNSESKGPYWHDFHQWHELIAQFSKFSPASTPPSSIHLSDSSLAVSEDAKIVALVIQLFYGFEKSEHAKHGLVVFDHEQQEHFMTNCLANLSAYIDAFNIAVGENILLPVKAEPQAKEAESTKNQVVEIFLDKAPLAENQRKKSRSSASATAQPSKTSCLHIDDICQAFNGRLRKLLRQQQFYALRGESENTATYLLCTQTQYQAIKQFIPLQRLR